MTTQTEALNLASDAYDKIDRFLRNNLGDVDYAEYSVALDSIYATPQQRKPLRDVEIGKIMRDCDEGQEPQEYTIAFVRAIEAAHGIKE